jgi:hypothetical protein
MVKNINNMKPNKSVMTRYEYKTEMEPLIKKFEVGDYVTDEELGWLLEHYETLERMLYAHGELYRLTWLHVNNQSDRALQMYKARKERKTKK